MGKCAGDKMSKERLMMLLHGNVAGNMEKPHLIRKDVKPCFKNLKIGDLSVLRCNNKRVCILVQIMKELNEFHAKMRKGKSEGD